MAYGLGIRYYTPETTLRSEMVEGEMYLSEIPKNEIRAHLQDVKEHFCEDDPEHFQKIARKTQKWTANEWADFFVFGALHHFAYHPNPLEKTLSFEPCDFVSAGPASAWPMEEAVPPQIALAHQRQGTAVAQAGLKLAIEKLQAYMEKGTIPAGLTVAIQRRRGKATIMPIHQHMVKAQDIQTTPITRAGNVDVADDGELIPANSYHDEPTLIKESFELLGYMQKHFGQLDRVLSPVAGQSRPAQQK